MIRCAVSVPSNIAEGMERGSIADGTRFIHIAKGSAAELRTQVLIAHEIGLMDERMTRHVTAELREISSMLQGLAKSLKARQPTQANS